MGTELWSWPGSRRPDSVRAPPGGARPTVQQNLQASPCPGVPVSLHPPGPGEGKVPVVSQRGGGVGPRSWG